MQCLSQLAVLLACLFGLMSELKFLVPYKRLIFHQYGTMLLAWLGILFVKPLRRDLLDSAQIFLKGYRPQVEAHRQPRRRRLHVDAAAGRRLERTLKCHAISHPDLNEFREPSPGLPRIVASVAR